MEKYAKSRVKINFLFLVCVLIISFPISFFFFMAIGKKYISIYAVIIINCITFFLGFMPKITKLYRQSLELGDDSLIFKDRPLSVFIKYADIISIRYSGTKLIPMSEMLIVKSKVDIIYIDFNFINYLDVWKNVITVCKNKNSNIVLDNIIFKRLNMIQY